MSAGAPRERWAGVAIVAAAAIAVSIPQHLLGFTDGFDAPYHVRWMALFAEQLARGDLRPTWLDGEYCGFGGPIFLFYPPLPYYLGALLPPVVLLDAPADLRLILGTNLANAIGAFGCYAWLRGSLDRVEAALGAVLYLLAPFHLTSIHHASSYPTMWTFAWMPLVLGSADRTLAGRPLAPAALALSVAALACTHLPTTLLFSLFAPIPYALAVGGVARGRRLRAVAAAAAGYLLAATYVLPAVAMLGEVSSQHLYSSYLDYDRWFLERPFFREHQPWAFGSLVLTAAAAAVAAIVVRVRGGDAYAPAERRRLALLGAIAAGMLFLATGLSAPLWKAIPVLARVQFPWRIAGPLSLVVAALLAQAALAAGPGGGSAGERSGTRAGRAVALVVAVVWLGFAVATGAQTTPLRGAERVERDRAGRKVLEWIPRRSFAAWSADTGQCSPGDPVVVEGHGTLSDVAVGPDDVRLRVRADDALTVVHPRFFFPTWEVRLDGAPVPARPRGPLALLSFEVPPGEHRVHVRHRSAPAQRLGLAGSALGLALVGGQLGLEARRRRAGDPERPPQESSATVGG